VPQFDLFEGEAGDLWLDCQSNLLRHLNSRFVVPLMTLDKAPAPAARLNPVFQVAGERRSLVTQFATAVAASDLRDVVGSLAEHRDKIIHALDTLMGAA
jgi:toxin CcdB